MFGGVTGVYFPALQEGGAPPPDEQGGPRGPGGEAGGEDQGERADGRPQGPQLEGPRAVYPWGWSPEGTREQIELPEVPTPSRWHGSSFMWGPRLWGDLKAYVAALRWPPEETPGGEAGVSHLELALDFEVAMGRELPFPRREGATGPGAYVHAGDPGVPGRSPAAAQERARTFGAAWRCLERRSQKPLHPGRKEKHTRTLRALGYNQPLSGFSRRPVLLGGEDTERALGNLLGLGGRGPHLVPPGDPTALRRRPAYRRGRPCLVPGASPERAKEEAAPQGAQADPAAKPGGEGGSRETAQEPPPQHPSTQGGAGTVPSEGGGPAGGAARPRRKSPAIIRMSQKERQEVYEKAAPGAGKHQLEQRDGEWQCVICHRKAPAGPKALRETTCFGPGMTRGQVISLQKKEAARARHLREAEAAREHNAGTSAQQGGALRHVLVPQGDTHTCELCGVKFSTMLRARNLHRVCSGRPAPVGPAAEEGPPDPTRHNLRRAGKDWECAVCSRRDSKKRLEATRCRGPGAKTKSELLVLHNADRLQAQREKERQDARAHNAAVAAGGKGDLRHVAVPAGEGEECEVCARRVAGGHNNRARFMSKVCPGPPGPPPTLTPEEEERRRRNRAAKDAYKERRRQADAQVSARPERPTPGATLPPRDPSRHKRVGRPRPDVRGKEGTSTSQGNATRRGNPAGDPARKGGATSGAARAPLRPAPGTGRRDAGGTDARSVPGGAAPPPAAQPAPSAKVRRRRGRAAPAAPE